MASNKTLYLLDGMALIYRAHFAFIRNPIVNSKGFNTSAVFGYTNTILDLIKNRNPTHLAVAFDTSAPTQRHIDFPKYKAQREEMPEDLRLSIPKVYEITRGFNIPTLVKDGYEADDLIGTIAKRYVKEGFDVYMVTPDKDFAQLVEPGIFMYKPGRQGSDIEILGVDEVKEKFGLESPEQVIDLLGLWGDSADNIPGVPGIGQKTGAKLIQEFGSIENILANTDKLKGKQRENLENFAEQARLSRKLATIWTDCPIDVSIEDLELNEPNPEILKPLFVELEFNAIGKRLFGDSFIAGRGQGAQLDMSFDDEPLDNEIKMEEAVFKTFESEKPDYKLIDSIAGIEQLVAELNQQSCFCFDTETTGLDVLTTDLLGVAFSYKPKTGYYVSIPTDNEEKQQFLDALRPVFINPDTEKIGHNIKFDYSVLMQHGIQVQGPLFDTMIVHTLVDPDQRHNMDFLAQSLLGYKPISITSLIGEKGKEQKSMADIPLAEVVDYASEDADITFQLKAILEPLLIETGQEKVYHEVEAPLISVLAKMEATGVRIDPETLIAFSAELEIEIKSLSEKIRDLAGTDFNLNSPKQLGQVLFDILKLDPKAKKTKTGQYATNEQVLTRLASKHEIVQSILDHRGASKLKNTYVDTLPGFISPSTGRIHTTYNQTITATGRLNSYNPNLQNIPIRTERGREIRKAFIAGGEEFTLLAADYSQIELRICAALSKEEAMMDAFINNLDIHSATAARIFDTALTEVTPDMRRTAKMVNFGIIYGISAHGLAQRLGIGRAESADIIDEYFKQYPKIKDLMESTIENARKHGYVETLLGRRRPLRDINSANGTVRAGAERVAINTPIQGTAADMIKIAMHKVQDLLENEQTRTRMLLQIHDELVFDLHQDERDTLPPKIVACMQAALPLSVPIVVDTGTGANWLEAH
ncbi:MAG: DNA polymerase I [Verrucomicrobia bacterium]|nr:DNA polymerase I [Verrucomicrobiota bacterium]MDA1066928.1 DNA polymerase I [Verrucomicrobiota bacterium]